MCLSSRCPMDMRRRDGKVLMVVAIVMESSLGFTTPRSTSSTSGAAVTRSVTAGISFDLVWAGGSRQGPVWALASPTISGRTSPGMPRHSSRSRRSTRSARSISPSVS
jgi:hypothetical protein